MTKLLLVVALGMVGCASAPKVVDANKAETIKTQMVHEEIISGDLHLGIKNGDMVVQRKVRMAEELRDLQNNVYEIEDHVYGTEKYGSLGQYGVLKQCRKDLSQRENGGDGKLSFTESMDRVTIHEEDMKIGLDEQNQLVGVTEEFLRDRIARFRTYKSTLEKRKEDLSLKQDICETDLKSRRYEKQASNH